MQRFNALFDRFMGHTPPVMQRPPPPPPPSFFAVMLEHVNEYSGWIMFFFLAILILGLGRRYSDILFAFAKKLRNLKKSQKPKVEVLKNTKVPCAAERQLAKRAQGIGRSLTSKSRDPADIIWSHFREAVVDLFMVFEEPGWFGSHTALYKGTAWFCTSDGYLVTAGHNAIMDASHGVVNGRLRRASQIVATVTNLNGQTNQNHALQCRIVNVCGRADVAVLHIKEVTNQKFIRWGSSLRATPGSSCSVIGDPLGQNSQSVATGIVRSNMFFEPSGQQIPESILTTALAFEGNSGSPILDTRGNAIGVYTFGDPTSPGFGGGITQRMAQPIVEEMIAYDRSLVAERSGTQSLFKQQEGKRGKMHPKGPFPHIDPDTGDFQAGFTGLVFNAYTALERYALGNQGTIIGGAVVVDKEDPTLFADIQVGDIITQIDGVVIGTLEGQTAPSTATLPKVPGDQVQLTLYRGEPNTVWKPMNITQIIGTCPAKFEYPLSYVAKKPVSTNPTTEKRKLLERSQPAKGKPFLSGPHKISESCEHKTE